MEVNSLGRLQDAVNKVAERIASEYVHSPPGFEQRKIFRDAVHGFCVLEPGILLLLDSPFLQRLRGLSQTSLARLTYPSSTHTRFEHSIGVYHMAGEMIKAYERSPHDREIKEPLRTEIRVAALLHDTGHGPFSHSSEDVYRRREVFTIIKDRKKNQFANASPSEILTWCLLRSPTFKILWHKVAAKFPKASLDDASLSRIGSMIVGSDVGLEPQTRHLRAIVNGPFDADKLDYLARDGHFTGLRISLDIQRLLWGLRDGRNPENDQTELCIDIGSLSALEQVIFCKAQLYGQLYHHHKVRAAGALITRLLERYEERYPKLGRNPAEYLTLTESSLLGGDLKDRVLTRLVARIALRQLPMRCLVMEKQTLHSTSGTPPNEAPSEEDERNESNWNQKILLNWRTDRAKVLSAERAIAAKAGQPANSVYVDAPHPASLVAPGGAIIALSDRKTMWLHDLFPAEGWANTYNAYRSNAYIFSDSAEPRVRRSIAEAAREWLSSQEVHFSDLAIDLARIPSP